ncbi:hypothetical protein ACLOJK_026856 [Asimina triloba]
MRNIRDGVDLPISDAGFGMEREASGIRNWGLETQCYSMEKAFEIGCGKKRGVVKKSSFSEILGMQMQFISNTDGKIEIRNGGRNSKRETAKNLSLTGSEEREREMQ